ncbi:P-loop containing nucleoside triphosphate hydrolase protein [Choiromyces venosus 120613-1]|uniref:P-loop containing nucleoside triphosphate hydrolase protein n=1 Tax=Choiromyces venosus 120613-1 TaxID=1336337 RepID=A0A3N4JPB1_9PEZI|nr:P-loop containing nucleoside triphosphate hydrolase protein [Choiromyces venosus 120613-1]
MRQFPTAAISKALGGSSSRALPIGAGSANYHSNSQIWWWWQVRDSARTRTTYRRGLGCCLIRPRQRASVDARGIHNHGFDKSEIGNTIYALATAPGRAAIAVVRVSGPGCLNIYSSLCPSRPPPIPRKATLRTIYRPNSPKLEILDPGALILYFPAPNSHTGEDVLELHLHGGPAIIRAVLTSISALSTPQHPIRPAGPGEFTRRAFGNNRLTLPQIEALGDTLSAETEQQRKLSVQAATSGLGDKYELWRRMLLAARGELEAIIDFSEDQQFETSPAEMCGNVVSLVQGLKPLLKLHVDNAMRGELLRSGISLALVGAPNAGKSSLLNRVVGREAAIVSGEAGTTRDVVDLSVDIGGYMVRLADTAGLRKAKLAGEIEKEGMRRAKKRVQDSHVVIAVLSIEETTDNTDGEETPYLSIPNEVLEILREAQTLNKHILIAVNKTDLLHHSLPPSQTLPQHLLGQIKTLIPTLPQTHIHGITCTHSSPDDGIQPLLSSLTKIFAKMTSADNDTSLADGDYDAIGATDRQRRLLEDCIAYLDAFLVRIAGGEDGEADVVVAAEELRFAAGCLAQITGKGEGSGDVEEVLGVVFEKFCVGK